MSSSSSAPKRIAILGTRGIPARYGGFETFAEELSIRLVSRGHSVTVYGRRGFFDGSSCPQLFKGVTLRNTATIRQKYLDTPVHALTSFIDVLQRDFDIFLLCNAANSPFAPILKVKRGKLLINVDGIERKRKKWGVVGKLGYQLGEWCSLILADKIISDAEVIAEYYRDRYRQETEVIVYGAHAVQRPPGETLRKFGLQPRHYLLYVSRLEPENNALGVVEAYRRSECTMPLVIVGDAPYADSYKAKVRASAPPSTIFTGFQFGEAYQELQSNCYAYIQATEVGGTHPALVEAMAYGNCVIANGTPENREVLRDAGLTYQKNNFDELAELMRRVVQRPALAREFREKARIEALSRFSWERVTDQYEALFDRVVAA